MNTQMMDIKNIHSRFPEFNFQVRYSKMQSQSVF